MHYAAAANRITKLIGGRVSLRYEERLGLPAMDVGQIGNSSPA
jgi:hypothetical protein